MSVVDCAITDVIAADRNIDDKIVRATHIMCKHCIATTCTYGANRRGSRTDACCVCAAQLEGWAGLVSTGCSSCKARRNAESAEACLPKQQEEQSKNEGKATHTFGDAVRELRQQRLKRAHAAQDQDTFLQAYNEAKKRRITQALLAFELHDDTPLSDAVCVLDAAPAQVVELRRTAPLVRSCSREHLSSMPTTPQPMCG